MNIKQWLRAKEEERQEQARREEQKPVRIASREYPDFEVFNEPDFDMEKHWQRIAQGLAANTRRVVS